MSKYRSKFEARCAAELGPTFVHEVIRLPYTVVHHYLPDFVDVENKIIVESKGNFRSSADRTKLIAVKKSHPEWRIIIWFQDADLKIAKGSKTSYRDWAIKHGFEVRE